MRKSVCSWPKLRVELEIAAGHVLSADSFASFEDAARISQVHTVLAITGVLRCDLNNCSVVKLDYTSYIEDSIELVNEMSFNTLDNDVTDECRTGKLDYMLVFCNQILKGYD